MSALAALVAVILFAWLTRFPLPEEASAAVGDATLVAYNADGATPSVLTRQDGVLRLTEMRLDWEPLVRLNTPRWHLKAASTEIAPTTDLASLRIFGCSAIDRPCEQAVVLVGEIVDPRIVEIELTVNGREQQLLVRVPGYIKHLPRNACLDDVTMRDANGRRIWLIDLIDDEAYERCLETRKWIVEGIPPDGV